MKHYDFTKEEHKTFKEKQISNLKKHYPDISVDDWILWIVPELFHFYTVYEIIGKIQVKKDNGNITEFVDIPYILRTPYPNKNIRQLSFVSGRKRLYGIPLLFKSFEELSHIKEIKITWEIYYPLYHEEYHESPSLLGCDILEIKYNLSFELNGEHPDYHFFTVFSKDMTNLNYLYSELEQENAEEHIKAYYEQFDIALEAHSSIMLSDVYDCENKPMSIVFEEYIDNKYIKPSDSNNSDTEEIDFYCYSEEELKTFHHMESLLPHRDILKKYLSEVNTDADIYLCIREQKRTETLHAEYMGDIIHIP